MHLVLSKILPTATGRLARQRIPKEHIVDLEIPDEEPPPFLPVIAERIRSVQDSFQLLMHGRHCTAPVLTPDSPTLPCVGPIANNRLREHSGSAAYKPSRETRVRGGVL